MCRVVFISEKYIDAAKNRRGGGQGKAGKGAGKTVREDSIKTRIA